MFLISVVQVEVASNTKAWSLANPTLPISVTILKAKIKASIISVGVTKEGNLDVPHNYTQVGWYKSGPKPGNMGSVVLDGHVDNGANIPGPFKNLHKVKIGDSISVKLANGKSVNYSVIATDIYDTNKFPGEKIFHENDAAYLKIITCNGTFIPAINTYDKRLVVTAILTV